MESSQSQAEENYMRARMGDLYIDDNATPDPTTASDSAQAEEASSIPDPDDSISARRALEAKEMGNRLYKTAEYESALVMYTRAASSAHAKDEDLAIAFSNRAAVYMKMEKWKETAENANRALELKPGYVKALVRRKVAKEKLGELRGALDDAKELGDKDEVKRLEKLVVEVEKKDVGEAMDGLKDLGNSILGNFGMSLNDFNMDKDPSTGSYNISMKR